MLLFSSSKLSLNVKHLKIAQFRHNNIYTAVLKCTAVEAGTLWVNVINCSLPNLQRATRVARARIDSLRAKPRCCCSAPDEGESSVSFSEKCQQNMNNKRRWEWKANCKLTACVGNRMASSARRLTSFFFFRDILFETVKTNVMLKILCLSKAIFSQTNLICQEFPQFESLRWFLKSHQV